MSEEEKAYLQGFKDSENKYNTVIVDNMNLKNELDTIKSRIHIKIERAERKLKNNLEGKKSEISRIKLESKIGCLKDILYEEYNSSEKAPKYSLENLRMQNKELRAKMAKKNKIIDEMARMINTHDIDEDICGQFGKDKDCSDYNNESLCVDCIKQYFIKKIEEQEQSNLKK